MNTRTVIITTLTAAAALAAAVAYASKTPACGNCVFNPTFNTGTSTGRLTAYLQPRVVATEPTLDTWTVTGLTVTPAGGVPKVLPPKLGQDLSVHASDATCTTLRTFDFDTTNMPSGTIVAIDLNLTRASTSWKRGCVKILLNGAVQTLQTNCEGGCS